ncbi:MAG: hypothetical protein AAGH40_12415 [Verrucomicrobiota bacterium]
MSIGKSDRPKHYLLHGEDAASAYSFTQTLDHNDRLLFRPWRYDLCGLVIEL